MGPWAPTSTTTWHAWGRFRRRNEARSVAQKALLRTTSTHGTGPSRHERPTLAFPERGGLVHDGPAAQDAGPLPGGRECCAATLQADHGYWQQRGGTDVDARAVLRQVTGADGSAAIRTGVQGERVRSLGHCGVITRALSAWTPAQRSRTDCLPASWSRCVGAERTVARLVHWHPAFSVWMDAGGAVVVCMSSGNHWAAVTRFGA